MKIRIGAIGPIGHKLSLTPLCENLNKVQGTIDFFAGDPIAPQVDGNKKDGNLLYYYPDQLISEIHQWNIGVNDGFDGIDIRITDNEIFEDLYSCLDQSNKIILVSLRTSVLKAVLAAAGKSYLDYVELEIAAQVLTALYRAQVAISVNPTECALPWHRARRNDIFDYYGLSPENVDKLMQPKMDVESRALFNKANVPNRLVDACLEIAKSASKDSWGTKLSRAFNDNYFAACVGAIVGFFASVFSTLGSHLWYLFLLPFLLVMAWRFHRSNTWK